MRIALILVAMAALSPLSSGQTQFVEVLRGRQLPPHEIEEVTDVVAVDVDGDCDFDLVVIGWLSPNLLYINDGRGVFTDVTANRLPSSPPTTQAVASGDVDGDGDADLVIGGLIPPLTLYLNDGSGVFVESPGGILPPWPSNIHDVMLADVDGDRDLDLAVVRGGGFGDFNLLYLNDGRGIFIDVTATHLPFFRDDSTAVAGADVDGDEDVDLVIANKSDTVFTPPQNRLLVNDGTGRFTEATTAQLPADAANSHGVAVLDADGDGDVDLVFANATGVSSQTLLYLNDGWGFFTDATASRMPVDDDNSRDVTCGDVDGDGDPDLLIANHLGQAVGDLDRVYLNDGAGIFAEAPAGSVPGNTDLTLCTEAADIDGDGDLDWVLGNKGNGQRLRLYDNAGDGVFTDVSAQCRFPRDAASTTDFAIGDLDGDGHPDMVLANDQSSNWVLLGDGTGVFDRRGLLPVADSTKAVDLLDAEGDGDLDLAFANAGGRNRLWLNDGGGSFSEAMTALPVDSLLSWDVTAADVDTDGDPDLVFANARASNSLYLNDGAGNFLDVSAARLPTSPGSEATKTDVGDVDGDGDLDLVFAELGLQPRLFVNDGGGVFSDASSQLPPHRLVSRGLALFDGDGDGDLDLVFANEWNGNNYYRNDGGGRFTDLSAQLPPHDERSQGVAVGDVDSDRDLDLVFANAYYGQQNRLYLNDGGGVFTDASARLEWVYADVLSVELADLDRDGDPDLLIGNDGMHNRLPNRLLTNLDTQALMPRSPYLGGRWQLEFCRQPDYGGSLLVALPALQGNAQGAAIPTPFGLLFLQPGFQLPLPWVSIPPATGKGSLVVEVPRNPVLVGSTVTVQALIVELFGSEVRLTNQVVDVIDG